MAQAKPEEYNAKKNPASDDFSVVQAGGADSILQNCSWPKQDENSFPSPAGSSRLTSAEEAFESNQIFASRYALSTAYARVTKKLAEAELRNQQLMMQDSLRGQENFRSAKMSGYAGSQTNYAMPPNLEASVNQAWEAYNEKCIECQQLREELERVKQQNDQTDHHSRIQILREDVLREKAKQDDVVRKLEKSKMDADNLEKKEIFAREELEKEREYQMSLVQIAEKKHNEMEQKIEELGRSLANEKSITEDLRQREKDRQNILEDEYNAKKDTFVAKIRELEERNIALKEEVSVLVSMQSASFNGQNVPNGPASGFHAASNAVDFLSDKDVSLLSADVLSLKAELNELRTRAAEQTHILSALFQNPKIITLLKSIDRLQNKSEKPSLQPSSLVGGEPVGGALAQINEEIMYKRKKANSLKMRNHANHLSNDGRQVIGSSPAAHQDIYGPNGLDGPLRNPRQIHQKLSEEAALSPSLPVLKPTEEFILGLTQEGARQNRKSSKALTRKGSIGTEYSSPLFPPMDVSRVIHIPESGSSNASLSMRAGTISNFSDDFDPVLHSSLQPNCSNVAFTTSSGPQSSQYYNGNIATYTRPLTNGQILYPPNMQNSLPAMDVDSLLFHSATSSSTSQSSTDTLVMSPVNKTPSVRPTNPFYTDLTESSTSTVTTRSVATPTSRTQISTVDALSSPNRNSKQPVSITKNLMDLDNDVPSPPRLPQGAANFDTPPNRYVSSDEDNDSVNFQLLPPRDSGGRQPKEFIVPKVVRAPDLATAQSRKAFQDSGYNAPPAQVQTRPPIRAKSETPSTPSTSRASRPDNGGPALPQQYPSGSSKNCKKNQDGAARTCPICQIAFTPEWTEDTMTRHINGHFSDEENEVLSLN